MNKTPHLAWGLFAFLSLAVVTAAWFKLQHAPAPAVTRSAPLNPDCDLRSGPCTGKLPGGGDISLSIEPHSIPVVKPLQLSVRTQGLEAESVEVDFSGADMNMGFNRPRLSREAGGLFQGTAMLPVCVRARMTWEARVLVHTPSGLVAAPFRFDTFQPGLGQ